MNKDQLTNWEEELKMELLNAGLKPIHFKMNNSGVRIINMVDDILSQQKKTMVEDVRRIITLKLPSDRTLEKRYPISWEIVKEVLILHEKVILEDLKELEN